MSVRLFVGGGGAMVQGESMTLAGDRCFSAAIRPQVRDQPLDKIRCLMDSGAFSDPPHRRLSAEGALNRQLQMEQKWNSFCKTEGWTSEALVSYDLLIDETWTGSEREKRRWSLKAAESAVEVTIDAARYLVSQRERVSPRTLVLAIQGVDAFQQQMCAAEILQVARPGDWIGLGGWCILGLQRSWLGEFWRTLYAVLPLVKARGLSHVHLFGVMWVVPLGGLLWMCDQLGLSCSTDSFGPIKACLGQNYIKGGARCHYWRDNVAWWQNCLVTLRDSPHYKEPPRVSPARQLELF